MLIFPEGTRSADGNLLPFMKGAFSLAAGRACPSRPLPLWGPTALQPPGARWPSERKRRRAGGKTYTHGGKRFIL